MSCLCVQQCKRSAHPPPSLSLKPYPFYLRSYVVQKRYWLRDPHNQIQSWITKESDFWDTLHLQRGPHLENICHFVGVAHWIPANSRSDHGSEFKWSRLHVWILNTEVQFWLVASGSACLKTDFYFSIFKEATKKVIYSKQKQAIQQAKRSNKKMCSQEKKYKFFYEGKKL